MSLFRCEEMALHQLFLQSEAAYTCVGEIGEIGLVQFRDMNPDVNAFQRNFVGEVRRCDEMERKLRFIEREVKKEPELHVLDTVAQPNQVPDSRDMNELEIQLERLENELRELLSNQETLEKNFLELTELKQVLERTQTFFQEADRHRYVGGSLGGGGPGHMGEEGVGLLDDAENMGTDGQGGSMKLGVVAGVINRDKLGAFERILWRVCRGNVYMKQTDIEVPLKDPSSGEMLLKSVFIVFYQGDQLGTRVKKICEGFRATLYPCPDQQSERREMLSGVESRISDLRAVLDQTLSHRLRVLESAAVNLPMWMVKVKKIKAIYHTLNLFQVSQKYLQVQCWIPVADVERIQEALNRGTAAAGSSVPSVLTKLQTQESPPTFNRSNKFTAGFQNIIDAYGVATYREMNPMPFTVISFPFLFAVMFGDFGHGTIMAMFGALLVWKENQIIQAKSKNEIFMMFFAGRYVILMMGLFSIYTGLIYNDIFSLSVNIFGSQWDVSKQIGIEDLSTLSSITLDPKHTFDGNSPYPFGFDPIWQLASNKLTFQNSYKMKMSVILGVIHMTFGIIVSFMNHTYFRKPINIFCEFIPQMIFFMSLFGYLVFMIFYKWFAYGAGNSNAAPNLLTTLINMFMQVGSTPDPELFPGQGPVQAILVVLAVICIPWMLLVKPAILFIQHRNPAAQSYNVTTEGLSFKNLNNAMNADDQDAATGLIDHDQLANENDDTSNIVASNGTSSGAQSSSLGGGGEISEEKEFDFAEIMILQAIHTIEFCLSCISHTASYLRLWALSLAHAELSEVLWSMIMEMAFSSTGLGQVPIIVFIFAAWAVLTIAILLLMEGLSAFLHALRLHWVEFQSKFYNGEGHLFAPFSFQHIIDNPFDE